MAINEQEIQEIVRNVLKGMGTATAPAASKAPEFIEELRAHGYSEERLKKVAGENWLRLFKNTFGK